MTGSPVFYIVQYKIQCYMLELGLYFLLSLSGDESSVWHWDEWHRGHGGCHQVSRTPLHWQHNLRYKYWPASEPCKFWHIIISGEIAYRQTIPTWQSLVHRVTRPCLHDSDSSTLCRQVQLQGPGPAVQTRALCSARPGPSVTTNLSSVVPWLATWQHGPCVTC